MNVDNPTIVQVGAVVAHLDEPDHAHVEMRVALEAIKTRLNAFCEILENK